MTNRKYFFFIKSNVVPKTLYCWNTVPIKRKWRHFKNGRCINKYVFLTHKTSKDLIAPWNSAQIESKWAALGERGDALFFFPLPINEDIALNYHFPSHYHFFNLQKHNRASRTHFIGTKYFISIGISKPKIPPPLLPLFKDSTNICRANKLGPGIPPHYLPSKVGEGI